MSSSSSLSNHYASLLKLSSQTQNHSHVKNLHCFILKTLNLSADTFLSNSFITCYSKCNLLGYARNLFDQIHHPNLFSWNAILSAYSKAGRLPQMEQVFSSMPGRDGVSWNALISGYAGQGSRDRAVGAYCSMLREGCAAPNRITFSTMLILSSACSSPSLGQQVHCQIIKFGFESYVFVGSPLVDMYSKSGLIRESSRVFEGMKEKNIVMYNTMMTGLLRCGMVEDSKKLFGEMAEKDSISWTTMVTGLTQNGLELEAINLFRDMRAEDVPIDQFTFGSALTACGLRKQSEPIVICKNMASSQMILHLGV
ncbi:hypothetical protein Cni_G27984 [Canna indica]|uniref:Pentatricopeptide repeat-containing protein n=1 Tax=Canna indica TaxID=4628 RepID=A0AAQ3L8S7_9LILI|nr:hypothetical protein Cni_G27984 [Canna indica]